MKVIDKLYKKLCGEDSITIYNKLTLDEASFVIGGRGVEIGEALNILAKGHKERVEKSTLVKTLNILCYPILLISSIAFPLLGLLMVLGFISMIIFLVLAFLGVISF